MLQFGKALPRILQAAWEADPAQDPFLVSNLDVTDAYYRDTSMPSQVGTFVYVVPSALGGEGCIICIDLVLLIGWVESPNFSVRFRKR